MGVKVKVATSLRFTPLNGAAHASGQTGCGKCGTLENITHFADKWSAHHL